MGTLKLYSAGAGSGKTRTLCDVVAAAIRGGTDPARVLATTFTRKAAAELKGRIQARLLADSALPQTDRLTRAERLELALIGTVHSVGHQLLARYALPLGLSPRLTVLEEAGSDQALRDLLGQLDPEPWLALAGLTLRFGLGKPQDLVVDLLDAKRTNRIGDAAFRVQMRESAERLCALMGPAATEAEAVSFASLIQLADEALARIERIQDSTGTTPDARLALRQLRDGPAGVWKDFIDAVQITARKRSGADEALADLRAAAATVLRQPALQQDVRALLGGLCERTLALDAAYARYKRERGLMDFTDLEVWLLDLLEDPRLTPSLQADIQLVAVDEFHDTNPLQLAIFERLRAIAAHSVWVGDPKQSIYAFRGTDPALFQALWATVPAASREPLPRNYRSQAGLVDTLNRLFGPVFGAEAALEPGHPGQPRGIERWLLEVANVEQEAEALAAGILQLHREGTRLRDIAVLARTNEHARRLGTACRTRGVPALLELPGLLATREGALVVAGLRLVADRLDSLAAATILHLLGDPAEPTPAWLAARLEALRARERACAAGMDEDSSPGPPPFAGDPRLAPLEGIDRRTLPPALLVRRVIDALEVVNRLPSWGDAAARAANLDGLVALAQTYEDEARTLGRTATLTGLITQLEHLAETEADQATPPYGIDAVTIITYHSSKGLEWETVILTGLDSAPKPRLWEPEVRGGDPAGEDPLAGRLLRYWPWPFGGGGRSRNLPPQANLHQIALDSVEGQEAITRAAAEEQRLRAWADGKYPGAAWHTEVPVTAPRRGGGQWNGSVDLLLRLSDGSVVIVDHKSGPISRDQCEAKASSFAGQLVAYRDALMEQGIVVRDTLVHFPLTAAIARLEPA